MNGAAPLWMNSTDSILEVEVLMKMQMDLQKRFPTHHVCPKCLAHFCDSAFLKNGLASRQDREKVGVTLVDW